jgi:hypothetical protein
LILGICLLTLLVWVVAVRLCRHSIAREPFYEKALARVFRPRLA